jgi:hypothetical protein
LKEFRKTKFNTLETVRSIVAAWKEFLVCSLNAAAIQQDFEGFEDVAAVDKETALLGESTGLEVDQDDVEDLFQSHNNEVTTEDLH